MSYIRSHSNPEQLYIVSTICDKLEIFRPMKPTLITSSKSFLKILEKCYNSIEIKFEDECKGKFGNIYFDMNLNGITLTEKKFNWTLNISYSTWYFILYTNKYRWLNEK